MNQIKIIHPGNFQCFIDCYRKHLIANVMTKPDQYAWDINDTETVMERMTRAIERGTFNKDTESFKATCKELKIKHTYKAIAEFISL
jgi:hypothetical protein